MFCVSFVFFFLIAVCLFCTGIALVGKEYWTLGFSFCCLLLHLHAYIPLGIGIDLLQCNVSFMVIMRCPDTQSFMTIIINYTSIKLVTFGIRRHLATFVLFQSAITRRFIVSSIHRRQPVFVLHLSLSGVPPSSASGVTQSSSFPILNWC